jgi:signal transduction histidine kinase
MEQIEAFGAQAAIAIEHATFQDRAKRHAVALEKEIAERKRAEQRLETQHAITRLLGEAAEPREAVPEMVRLLAEGIGWDAGGAWEPAPGGGLRCTHAWTAPGGRLDAFAATIRDRVFPRGEGMPGRVWASRTPEWCEDVGQDPLHPKSGAAAAGLRAAVAIPVTVGGETVGVVAFLSRKPVPKDPDLLAMMTNVGAQFGQFVARKRQERAKVELEAMFRQAQKMDAIGRLAGGVAHDFNNMLTVIQGYGQLAMNGVAPATPMHEYLHEIAEAARRSGELTRQLLVFSREQVQPARVLDPNEIVRGVQKMLRRLLGEDIELEVSLDPDPGRVRADPGQLEQVIVNLAVNARDAMPSGGRLLIQTRPMDLDEAFLRTRATECRPGHYVAITVTDTGSGIAPDVLPHIFEPFFTTKEAGKGTGLGLATVYGIVMQGGGLVSVYSEPGRGATFKVFLPRVAPLEGDPTEGMVVPPPARGTETVLVVEDDPQLRQLTRKLLEHHGYRVLSAEGADAALALAAGEAEAIDLLLTDIVLPRVNGVDLARRLQEKRPGMRVMFTSGYTGRSLEASGVLEHPDAFIEKPFTADDLARQVRLVIERPVAKA